MVLSIRNDILPAVEKEFASMRRDAAHEMDVLAVLDAVRRLPVDQDMLANPFAFNEYMDRVLAVDPLSRVSAPVARKLIEVRGRVMGTLLGRFPSFTQAIHTLTNVDVTGGRTKIHADATANRQWLDDTATHYLKWAAHIGREELAAALVIIGEAAPEEQQDMIRLLTGLGKTLPKDPCGGITPLLTYDPNFLALPTIRTYVRWLLEFEVNRHLETLAINGRDFGDNADGRESVRWLGAEVDRQLLDFCHRAGVPPSRHAGLFHEVKEKFMRVGTMAIPACFPQTLQNNSGVQCPFPSWDQRWAIDGLIQNKEQYVCLTTGGGKTAVPIVAWKILQEQQKRKGPLLLMAHPNMVYGIANRIAPQARGHARHRYFADGTAPSVGVISSEVDNAGFTAVMGNDIVVGSYHMLNSKRGGRKVIDQLAEREWLMTGCDEMHLWASGGGSGAQMLAKLMRASKYRCGLSATPELHDSLRGLHTATQLLSPPATPGTGIEQKAAVGHNYRPPLPPLPELRSRIRRLVCMPRMPENWLQHIGTRQVALSHDHQRVLRNITYDRTQVLMAKLARMELAIRCPWLFHGRGQPSGAPSQFLETLVNDTVDSLARNERHVELVLEDWLVQGIFTQHPELNGDTFFQRFQDRLIACGRERGLTINVHAIHGSDGGERNRERIYEAGREAATRGEKHVIMAQTDCLNLGVELPFVDHTRRLGPALRVVKMRQELGRSRRAGHEAGMTVYAAQNTIHGPKQSLAQRIYHREQRCLRPGQAVTDEAYDRLTNSTDGADDRVAMRERRIRLRMHSAETPEDRTSRWDRQLHGQGSRIVRDFFHHHDPEWALTYLTDTEFSGLGNQQRLTAALVRHLEGDTRFAAAMAEHPTVHVGSHGCNLARRLHELDPAGKRRVISMDPTPSMQRQGRDMLASMGAPEALQETITGGATQMRQLMDSARLPLAGAGCVVLDGFQEYAWRRGEKREGGKENTGLERVRALLYSYRLLQPGSPMVIVMPRTACRPSEFLRFIDTDLTAAGFTVDKQLSGQACSDAAQNDGEPASEFYVAVAVKGEPPTPSFEPTWKHVSRRLPKGGLEFTHLSNWGREQTADEDRRRGLRQAPFSLIHTDYTLHPSRTAGTTALRYGIAPPHRGEQIEELRQLRVAVAHIRGVAATPAAWGAIAAEARNLPAGVTFRGGQERPEFLLGTAHLFYPYDPQWNP